MLHRYRQEVFNVLLAQLLQERGIISAPEDMLKLHLEKSRRVPDVIVDFAGLRTAIEGEVDDQPDYAKKAMDSATKRVEEGVAHIGIAIVYPSPIRNLSFARLKRALASCELRIAVVTEGGSTSYTQGTVEELGEILRRAFGGLVQEDVVSRAVSELEAGIEKFASTAVRSPGIVARLADVLGIRELPERKKASDLDDEE